MGCEDEVLKIGRKLDKMVSNNDQGLALDLLKSLRELPITLEVLQKTRIGMSVNALRKSSNDEDVITISKTLIKAWKKLLSGAPSNAKTECATRVKSEDKTDTTNGGSEDENKKSPPSSQGASTSSPGVGGSKSSMRQTSFPSDTTNTVRLKCREMLTNALKIPEADLVDMPDDSEDIEELGAKIEDCIFKEFKDTNMKYKNKIRSRVSNLKDPKNPNLRLNVIRGAITPEKLGNMSSEEMASDELKQLRQKLTTESINDHQLSVTSGTKTQLLKCPKCRKNNCTYNQVQTRSADEPMTTFCLCNECGNRWKFC